MMLVPVFSCTTDLSEGCAMPGCDQYRERDSLYCKQHRDQDNSMVGAMSSQPNFAAIWQEAVMAGRAAGESAVPTPMVVVERDPMSGAMRQGWRCDEGPCGFAWVVVRPGTCRFVRWVKKNTPMRGHAEYGGGYCVYWVGEFQQSVERKYAFAKAFAAVLRKHGINAVARERLD